MVLVPLETLNGKRKIEQPTFGRDRRTLIATTHTHCTLANKIVGCRYVGLSFVMCRSLVKKRSRTHGRVSCENILF